MGFPFRLAVSDIDGTLAEIGCPVSDANLRAMRRLGEMGVVVALASGRHHANMRRYFEGIPEVDWVISSQGAKVANRQGDRVLCEHHMDGDAMRSLMEEGLSRGFSILLYSGEGVLTPRHDGWVRFYEDLARNEVRERSGEALMQVRAHKMVWVGHEASIDACKDSWGARAAWIAMKTQPNLFELMPECSNKGDAVRILARALGIRLEEVVTFGDAVNDVPMLSGFGCGVAMAHGSTDARQAADRVAPEVEVAVAFAAAVEQLIVDFSL
jgi:Cof subfamily protein (haloacid dehalogenase superfamily)